MTTTETIILIAVAALINASFALSLSLLTIMSGHALGKQTAHNRLMRLTSGFVLGAFVVIVLLVSFGVMVISLSLPDSSPAFWTIVCGLLAGVGLAAWVFYYRRSKGTTLWIPRSFAKYLSGRARSSRNPAEAFGLGMSSIISELLFCFAPMLVAAALISQLSDWWPLVAIFGYGLIAVLPQIIVLFMIGGGVSISKIQKWREQNKYFLQFMAGGFLLVLGVYLYVTMVVSGLSIPGASS